jgi:iron(III) transport system permease protein
LALIVLTLILIAAQLYLWGKGRHYYRASRKSALAKKPSSRAYALIFGVLLSAFFLPVSVFSYWMVQGWLQPTSVNMIWGTGFMDLMRYAWHGFLSAGAAATIGLLFAMPMAYLTVRFRDRAFSRGFAWLSQAGLALPGVLVALGLALVLHRYLPDLYFNVTALVIAYLILFFPFAYQTLESGLSQVPQSLEEAARTLRQKTFSIWRQVTFPLLVPGLLTAWVFVFTNALRELPATLLLRPPGFDTLPVRIWIAAGEGYLAQAAPAALLLMALSLPLLFLLDPARHQSEKQ